MENQLVKVINESGLDKTKAQVLLENFSNYFELAADWENKTKMLKITDVTQVAEMKMAREGRLFLKQKRIDVEKTRKALKENALREGQTIDAIAKILTNLIIPIETELEEKEKFAEIQEAKRKAELKASREMELQPFEEFAPYGIDLGNIDENTYQTILTGAKAQHKAKIDAEVKAEAERIAREKAEAEERERIRKENEKLKAEAERKEKQLQAERAKAEKERKEADEKARKEREESERILLAERKLAAEKLELEMANARKLAAEIEAKKQAEEIERKEQEAKAAAEAKAKAEAEKKAQAAPDKEKLKTLIIQFHSIKMPEVKSEEAKKIVSDTETLIKKLIAFVEEKTNQL
jgi:hypothetical protein